MMQAEILDLFPTAVVKYRVDFTAWLAEIKALPMQHQGSHSYSQDLRVLDSFPELAQIVEQCCTDYAQQVLAHQGEQQLQTSWVNHSGEGDFTHEHIHSNAAIACCLYLDLPHGQDRIRFHKPDARSWGVWNLMFDLDPERAQRSAYAQNTVEIPVQTGDLLVWPAWLLHSVPPLAQQGDRWTLAANTMPRNGWGSRLHEFRLR